MSNKYIQRYRPQKGDDCLIHQPRLAALPNYHPLHSHTHTHACKTNTQHAYKETHREWERDRQTERAKIWEAVQSASTSTEPPTRSVPTLISAHMACVYQLLPCLLRPHLHIPLNCIYVLDSIQIKSRVMWCWIDNSTVWGNFSTNLCDISPWTLRF